MSPTVQAEESAVLLEDGTYEVELLSIKEHSIDNPSFGDGDVFKWSFAVVDEVDEEGDPIILDPVSNRKLTPLTKFWAWAVALGGQPEIGKPFNTDQLIGAHAMAQVEAKVKPDGTRGFPKIVALVAMPKQRNGARPERKTESPQVQATDNLSDELNAWWKKILGMGVDRKAVVEQSRFTYEKDPWDLSPEERDSIFHMMTD